MARHYQHRLRGDGVLDNDWEQLVGLSLILRGGPYQEWNIIYLCQFDLWVIYFCFDFYNILCIYDSIKTCQLLEWGCVVKI